MIENYDVPILFVIFNRPDCTKDTFEAISKIRPGKLFISADGPRPHKEGEMELCNQARAVIENIDWDCEVVKLYNEENLGCKNAVSKALKWFFNEVEYGIVLEDDCVPDESFFYYCQELLVRYQYDERIGMICGRNDFNDASIENSYDYSTSGSIWGWASWRRVIESYDENAQHLLLDFKKNIYNATVDKFERNRLFHQLKWSLDNSLNTWDYQLHVLLKLSSMLYVVPKNNLIKNIGFGENATHTTAMEQRVVVPVKALELPLTNPRWVIPNRRLSRKIVRADSNNFLIWLYVLLMNRLRTARNKSLKKAS